MRECVALQGEVLAVGVAVAVYTGAVAHLVLCWALGVVYCRSVVKHSCKNANLVRACGRRGASGVCGAVWGDATSNFARAVLKE